MTDIDRLHAMAFYHAEGFAAAHDAASAFASPAGRIATVPDVLESRMRSDAFSLVWARDIATLSSEFLGLSRAGNPIMIVAHGVGPLSSKEGILAAYAHERKDKTRNASGGRIDLTQFRALEDGVHGDVFVIDANTAMAGRTSPFEERSMVEALDDPLCVARLGGTALAERFLAHLDGVASAEGYSALNKPIRMTEILNGDGSYTQVEGRRVHGVHEFHHLLKDPDPDRPHANLLSIGQLFNVRRPERKDLQFEIGPNSWFSLNRVVAIRPDAPVGAPVHRGVPILLGAAQLMAVARPNPHRAVEIGMTMLEARGHALFATYPKRGRELDSREPMHPVSSAIPLGRGRVEFPADEGALAAYYSISDVAKVAPASCNAYRTVGEFERVSSSVMAVEVEFYDAEVDQSILIPRHREIEGDYDLVVKVVAAEQA